MSNADDVSVVDTFDRADGWRRNRGSKIDIDPGEPRRMSPMDIERDKRKVERAARKLSRQLGAISPTVEQEITDHERTLFGRPVRIEIDVCIPIADLKKYLNQVRAELTNAIMALEKPGEDPNSRRFTAHQRLQMARAIGYQLKQELQLRGKAQTSL
jgi:hypothetical protein